MRCCIGVMMTALLAPSAVSAGTFPLETILRIEIAGIGVVADAGSSASAQSDGLGAFANHNVS